MASTCLNSTTELKIQCKEQRNSFISYGIVGIIVNVDSCFVAF